MSELTHTPGSAFLGADWNTISNHGYKIITTIDKSAEDAAVKYASHASKASPTRIPALPKKLQAAIVAVQPGTGRVIAYYGGDNGNGVDYAGIYYDKDGDPGRVRPLSGWIIVQGLHAGRRAESGHLAELVLALGLARHR